MFGSSLFQISLAAIAVTVPFIGVRYPLAAAPSSPPPRSAGTGLVAVPDVCVDPSSSLPFCLQPQQLPGDYVRTLSRQLGANDFAKRSPVVADAARRYGMVTGFVNQYTSVANTGIVFVSEMVLRFRSSFAATAFGRANTWSTPGTTLDNQVWHEVPTAGIGSRSWMFVYKLTARFGPCEYVAVVFIQDAWVGILVVQARTGTLKRGEVVKIARAADRWLRSTAP